MDNRNFNRKDGGYGRSGIVKFLDKQGIYIIMLVCLALIGITAYFALGSGGGEEEQAAQPSPTTAPAGAQQDTTLEEEIKKLQATPTPSPKPTSAPTATPAPSPLEEEPVFENSAANAAPAVQKAAEPEPTPEPLKALMPVEGSVIRPYSPEEPVFYTTLNEWMVHLGIDIEAPDDTDVRCALNGTVETVENRAETGYTVVVDHGEGIKTLYGNLNSPDGVVVGQQVSRGEAIGKVGRSATGTISDPAHVHFEYSKDGTRENPEEICVWNDNQ